MRMGFIMAMRFTILLFVAYTSKSSGASSDSFYFTVNPNDQDVEEGQPLRLRCAVTPSKDIYYSWLHNGSRINMERENGRRYLEVDSNLQILHADRELDQGLYQCQALNRSSTFTSASQEAKINIYWMEPDVRVVLVKPTQYEEIRFGQEVELACDAEANPPLGQANIKWYHNGNARLPNTEFLRNGNLRIAPFGVEHVGSYHCRVVHAAGKLDSRPPYVLQLNEAKPPQIITSFKHEDFNKFVMRGRSVELACPKMGAVQKSVDGIPPITIWGFMPRLGEQQQSVSALNGVQLLDSDSKLAISNFDHHHANYYTCETSWPGSTEKYVFLFQVEMATLYSPKRSDFSPRLKKTQPYVVQIGADAELRYYSDQSPTTSFAADHMSNPAPMLQWYKKGEQQPIMIWPHPSGVNIGQPRPRRYALRGRHLIIHRVTESDSGTYEMVLINVAGRASISFDLLVTFQPEFYDASARDEYSIDEDESVTLDCGVKRRSIPGSLVYWEKDERVLKKHAKSLMLFENDGQIVRFPQIKPEDQGQYQCFVQTDGYPERAAGRGQKIIVKGKLQFLREMREYFLEMNSQGRIPCKARGYGTLKVEWFRKTGSRDADWQTIRAPNQVDAGTLVIPYVQKSDAGDYVCVAQSSYRNARINMTVRVIVGKKPQISQISPNQTVRVGMQLILNCHASGDPPPQVSWIVKQAGHKMSQVYTPVPEPTSGTLDAGSAEIVDSDANDLSGPLIAHNEVDADPMITSIGGGVGEGTISGKQPPVAQQHHQQQQPPPPPPSLLNPAANTGSMVAAIARHLPPEQGRVTAYQNGSLVISQAYLIDQTEYICVAGNKHAIKTRQGVFVRVLTPEEYTRRQLGEEGPGSSMMRTILTVVGCAVAYLGLIIGLSVFCSMRMVRTRRKRNRKAIKMHENGQLLNQMGEANGPNGATAALSQASGGCPGTTLDSGLLMLTGVGSGASCGTGGGGSVTFSHMTPQGQQQQQQQQTLLSNLPPGIRGGPGAYVDQTSIDQATHHAVLASHGTHLSNGMGLPAIPTRGDENDQDWWPWSPNRPYYPRDGQAAHELINDPNGDPVHSYAVHQMPMYNGLTGPSPGVDSSTIATTASESQLMSAPPPTPLDSRSHFSGLSSGNSTSLYSRSLLSGASNLGSPAGAQNTAVEQSPTYGLTNGAGGSGHAISQMDRMHYPRCELKVEGILGKGEFGDVFLARARHIQEEEAQSLVLVKSLASLEPVHINEFHRQLELFGKLNHEHVTRLLGICMEQEPFYMLLEYCEWGDLKMFLRRIREENGQTFKIHSLSLGQKVKMCKQLASAMDHLAQMHCVHRDLAARNVLLTQDLDVKISSLGLARDVYVNEYYRLPNTEQLIPLRWFAPELIAEAVSQCTRANNTGGSGTGSSGSAKLGLNNNALPYSSQSDVWAFGVLVCEIFSLARMPMARQTDQEIIYAATQTVRLQGVSGADAGVRDFSPLRPDVPMEVPTELTHLLHRCWSPSAMSRPIFREIFAALNDQKV
ncbi:Inactive tyrosine-protein kinase 7 [Fasciola gigantica]|uniref:receptor protein-tyrosine kinase n=1 Tax=Fasciola gigantica TaxID=46835 RepID=A0A504Y8I7_FASGI|nr:Inactive tyrosine-protein kinase 7 [Fasciola gigantica]